MGRPTVLSSSMSWAIKINGIDLLDFGLIWQAGASHMAGAPLQQAFENVPGRHSAYVYEATFRSKPFTLSGDLVADSAAQLRTNLDAFNAFMMSLRGEQYHRSVEIRVELSDYSDRYWPCHITSFLPQLHGQNPSLASTGTWLLGMIQHTPFAIAIIPTKVTPTATGTSFTVLSLGTAPSPGNWRLKGQRRLTKSDSAVNL